MSKYKSYCSECPWSGDYTELLELPDGFNVCPECHADTHVYPDDTLPRATCPG